MTLTDEPWLSTRAFTSWLNRTAAWIETHDDHAEYHVNLLRQVALALDDRSESSQEERDTFAQKLERYRYQHLNEHSAMLTEEDQALVDLLDLTANHLAGRPPRPARAPRHAIHDKNLETPTIQAAFQLLDPQVPLESVVAQATALTQANFSRCGSLTDPGPNAESPAVRPSDAGTSGAASRRMLVYAPLYVSNECVNYCTYCGFRYPRHIGREHLNADQVASQANILHERGFRHLLVVSGDFPAKNKTAYFEELITRLVAMGIVPAIEIAAQTTHAYATLAAAGVWGLTLYQETYDIIRYADYHVRGPKASFHWRLESHDRAAEAGFERLGLGILLGLAEPAEDLRAMLRHASYLANRFPDRSLAFSLPRIHEAPDNFLTPFPVSDDTLIRLYCALRIAFPRAELVLSTRESAALRNRLARICITQMSAGSSTSPGGYERSEPAAGEQFPVCDTRTPAEVVAWLRRNGFQVMSLPNLIWN